MHDAYADEVPERDQRPLLGVVLCCTSIAPEQRDHIAAAAREMGAITKLDLTSDVTHLIVGDTDTAKYRYVAKERQDIRVLDAAWLEAVRDSWIEGGETDLADLDMQHRLPTFWKLNICVTGFYDVQERNDISEAIESNGAQYHGDLTKAVTHLVAAAPTGKKYEYAGQWGIKIVAKEWLNDSLTRGMILDESLYHPAKPVDERGQGAVTQRKQPSPITGKRMRDSTGQDKGRRKLRRTASSKLESQNDNIWADMRTSEKTSMTVSGAEWDDRPDSVQPKRPGPDVQDSLASLPQLQREEERPRTGDQPPSDLVFQDECIYVFGFDNRQTTILHNHLTASGATLCSQEELLGRRSQTAEDHDSTEEHVFAATFLVPNNMKEVAVSALKAKSGFRPSIDRLVTDWWAEKCMFNNRKLPPGTPLCQPLVRYPLDGFESLLICPTSISGMDLLHFSKATTLLGAKYDECLRPETSVLVCGGSLPNAEKLKYAVARGIPVVSIDWMWACIANNRLVRFEQYLLIGSRKQRGVPSRRTDSASTKVARQPQESTTESSRRSRSTSPKKNADPQALRDVTSHSNSQQRSGRSQHSQQSGADTLEGALREKATDQKQTEHQDAENEGPDDDQTIFNNDSMPIEPQAPPPIDKIHDAIAHIQARRKEASHSDAAPAPSRRYRPLGRAISNPSSLGGGGAQSFASSEISMRPPDVDEDEDDLMPIRRNKDVPSMFRPSQALTYEHEDALAAREKLLKHSGAKTGVDGALDGVGAGRGMQRVESIGLARDTDVVEGVERAGKTRRAGRKK